MRCGGFAQPENASTVATSATESAIVVSFQ
jgi:hypothetical protein